MAKPGTKYARQWREKNRLRHKLYMRHYHAKNRDRLNDYQRWNRVKRLYGLTQDEVEAILRTQSGGCALCGRKPGKYRLAIDHDHETGVVRGILCIPCNRALGSLGDSITGLRRVIRYLQGKPIPPPEKVLA